MKDGIPGRDDPNTASRLGELGFEPSAKFTLVDKNLELDVFLHQREKGVYAFALGSEVKYIGETRQEFYRRVYFYKNPGPTQQTNIRVNRLLLEALKSGSRKECEVWFLPESRITKGSLHLRLAESSLSETPDISIVERVLITHFGPEWNRH